MSINFAPRAKSKTLRVQIAFTKPSKTLQSHADACDINKIVDRYARTGALPPNLRQPTYGDVTQFQGDLTTLLSEAATTIQTATQHLSSYVPPSASGPTAQPVAPATPTT